MSKTKQAVPPKGAKSSKPATVALLEKFDDLRKQASKEPEGELAAFFKMCEEKAATPKDEE